MAGILVVDDSAFMRRLLHAVLTEAGHEVVGEACDGADAVAQYMHVGPELTTMDITMPNRDGLCGLRDILSYAPSARILMCSALGQEHKVAQALRDGAKGFVVKPFAPADLLDAVEHALA
jgi:two-component system chemotaxis response regulator CheY